MRAVSRPPRGINRLNAIKAARERAAIEGRPLTARELQPDGIVRNGGARPGAGRPRGFPWKEIRQLVETTGAPLDEVLALRSIPPHALEDAATMQQLRDEVARAHCVYRLRLREL